MTPSATKALLSHIDEAFDAASKTGGVALCELEGALLVALANRALQRHRAEGSHPSVATNEFVQACVNAWNAAANGLPTEVMH